MNDQYHNLTNDEPINGKAHEVQDWDALAMNMDREEVVSSLYDLLVKKVDPKIILDKMDSEDIRDNIDLLLLFDVNVNRIIENMRRKDVDATCKKLLAAGANKHVIERKIGRKLTEEESMTLNMKFFKFLKQEHPELFDIIIGQDQ